MSSTKQPLRFLRTPRAMPETRPIELRRIDFKEIYQPPKQSHVNLQGNRCLDCGNPYCEWKCPLHNYIPKWLDLASKGNIFQAAELCHQTNPLPEMCGRICPQDRLCEGACTLNDGFGAVTIGNIESYITDTALEQGWRPNLSGVVKRQETVAIIGSGPAGLACADELCHQGIAPVVYDSHYEIGGLLTFGIPPFKLDKSVVKRRRQVLEEMGVTFKLNQTIGKDIALQTLIAKNDDVFLGMGTYQPVTGNLDPRQYNNVILALPYLIDNVNSLLKNDPLQYNMKGKSVVVLGGGDTAMDCVRTAIRQGAKEVRCVYRRDKSNMPGSATEVRNAEEEGVKFLFCQQPLNFISEDGVATAVELAATVAEQASDSERITFTTNSDEKIAIEANVFIMAFGFKPNPQDWLADNNIQCNDWGGIQTMPTYPFQTTNPKVFAGGDMVRGSDLVVTAIADGKKAANNIIDYFDEHQ